MKKIRISAMLLCGAFAVSAQDQPVPPVPPAPPVVAVTPEIPDAVEIEKAIEYAADAVDRISPKIADTDLYVADAMKQLDEMRFKLHAMPKLSADLARLKSFAYFAQPQPPQPPQGPQAPQPAQPGWKPGRYNPERQSEDNLYRAGQRHLDRREYDQAVEAFNAAAAKKGQKADGALYWKAYALARLGRRDEAVAALNDLQKLHAGSRWLDDAKALTVEVRQASGQAVSPESQSDEELKLMALNALMQSDPERAVPMLEKVLGRGGSPKLKERALFVLAQSRTPEAQKMLAEFAKGKGNPDLQMKAVEYLGIHGGSGATQVLGDVYASSNDVALKRRILQSFMIARDKDRIFAAAKSETNPELRREAINLLGVTRALPELAQLYSSETNVDTREAIMQALFVGGAHDKLIELAKTETDPKLRREAIHRLGTMRTQESADALVSMYGSETDKKVKEQILQSLFVQGNAPKIIELARKETDPQMKREAVERLSHMKSKEATDFLIELLNK